MSSNADFLVGINTSEAEQQLAVLDESTKQQALKTLTTIRKSYDTLRLFGSLTGRVIDQSHQLIIDGLFTAADTFIKIHSAQALTGVGLVSAGLGLVAAAGLIAKGVELQLHPDRGTQQLDAIINLSNMYRVYS